MLNAIFSIFTIISVGLFATWLAIAIVWFALHAEPDGIECLVILLPILISGFIDTCLWHFVIWIYQQYPGKWF